MKKIINLVLIVGIIYLNLVFAEDSLSILLEEGEIKSYQFNGHDYNIGLVIVTDSGNQYAQFRINGNLTPKLYLNDIHRINTDTVIRFDKIFPPDPDDKIKFTLLFQPNCGNSICDIGEDCFSCSQDCGCQEGYHCESKQCVETIKCGDGKCGLVEICEQDSCCDGLNKDLITDLNNCGSCGSNQTCSLGSCVSLTVYCGDKTCDANENCGICALDCSCVTNTHCESNKCITYCGNGVCEANEESQCKEDCKWCGDSSCNNNENYATCPIDCSKPIVCGNSVCDTEENTQNCCKDCSCNSGFSCIDNNCVSLDKCFSYSDCNDNNTCTEDVCLGVPKKCSYNNITNCGQINNSVLDTVQPLMGTLSQSKEDSLSENKEIYSQEIGDSLEVEEDSGVIGKILNWIKELFGIK